MSYNRATSYRSPSRKEQALRLILACVLVLPLLLLTRPDPSTGRAQPALLALAAERPGEVVQVIVQKAGEGNQAELLVSDLGGEVVRDLHIINAFAAELSAWAARELATSPAVRWISLDGPVMSNQSSETITFQTWASELSPDGPNVAMKVQDFKDIPMTAGQTIWFNSIAKVKNLDESPVTVRFFDASIRFTADGVDYELEVPDGTITVSSATAGASTQFDSETGTWQTVIPFGYDHETFLTGVPFTLPVDVQDRVQDVTWSGRFSSDRPDLDFDVEWKWAAALYAQFDQDLSQLGIKPVKADDLSQYADDNMAGTPENYKSFLLPGARGNGDTNYTGDLSGGTITLGFDGALNIIDAGHGPDGSFGRATKMAEGFTGFGIEVVPGYAISKVEAMLHLYTSTPMGHDLKVETVVNGQDDNSNFDKELFAPYVGAANAGTIYLDVTDFRDWSWSDFFDGVTLVIDQGGFSQDELVYYDAVGFRITSTSSALAEEDAMPAPLPAAPQPSEPIDASELANVYNLAVRAPDVWNEAPDYLQGQGITVALVDSGIGKNDDIKGRVILDVNFNRDHHDAKDKYGHGTFVASIIAGDGKHSKGEVMGIAPQANLINVRISDDNGMSTELDVIEALQWVNDHRQEYDIRVVNLSVNAATPQSYHTSPLSAAVEILWFNGVVVVVSAGNNGIGADNGILYPPANDPFVITVGAVDDKGTITATDDTLATFSAYGVTESGFSKPDLVAPGRNIIAYLHGNGKLKVGKEHPDHKVDNNYFRMSGTSFSAPMVSGAVAILLQDEPNLTPDQVKYRLMTTAAPFEGPEPGSAGAGYLDIHAAVHGTSTESANTGLMASSLLTTGSEPVDSSVSWNSVSWNSVSWNSVSWNSVSWNSVSWNSVSWNSVSWDD